MIETPKDWGSIFTFQVCEPIIAIGFHNTYQQRVELFTIKDRVCTKIEDFTPVNCRHYKLFKDTISNQIFIATIDHQTICTISEITEEINTPEENLILENGFQVKTVVKYQIENKSNVNILSFDAYPGFYITAAFENTFWIFKLE